MLVIPKRCEALLPRPEWPHVQRCKNTAREGFHTCPGHQDDEVNHIEKRD